jgi:hypothetical protein
MRIQVAGSPLAGRLLALTAGVVVALALTLSVGGAAWAAPIPERTYSESSAPAEPTAPVVSERSYSDAPAVAATSAPTESAAVAPPTDDGMGAFVIALIAFGGVVALGGFACIGMRVAHHGHAAH